MRWMKMSCFRGHWQHMALVRGTNGESCDSHANGRLGAKHHSTVQRFWIEFVHSLVIMAHKLVFDSRVNQNNDIVFKCFISRHLTCLCPPGSLLGCFLRMCHANKLWEWSTRLSLEDLNICASLIPKATKRWINSLKTDIFQYKPHRNGYVE